MHMGIHCFAPVVQLECRRQAVTHNHIVIAIASANGTPAGPTIRREVVSQTALGTRERKNRVMAFSKLSHLHVRYLLSKT